MEEVLHLNTLETFVYKHGYGLDLKCGGLGSWLTALPGRGGNCRMKQGELALKGALEPWPLLPPHFLSTESLASSMYSHHDILPHHSPQSN